MNNTMQVVKLLFIAFLLNAGLLSCDEAPQTPEGHWTEETVINTKTGRTALSPASTSVRSTFIFEKSGIFRIEQGHKVIRSGTWIYYQDQDMIFMTYNEGMTEKLTEVEIGKKLRFHGENYEMVLTKTD
jgi:hypothetical protein